MMDQVQLPASPGDTLQTPEQRQPEPLVANIGVESQRHDISFEQSIRGMSQNYHRFHTARAALDTIDSVLREEQLPPVISFPVADGENDGVATVEVDIVDLVKKLSRSVDDRGSILRAIFVPIQQYLLRESETRLSRLIEFSTIASNAMQADNG